MIGQCSNCKLSKPLLKVKIITHLPLTDDYGNDLTSAPTDNFCIKCIEMVQENPILYNVEILKE